MQRSDRSKSEIVRRGVDMKTSKAFFLERMAVAMCSVANGLPSEVEDVISVAAATTLYANQLVEQGVDPEWLIARIQERKAQVRLEFIESVNRVQ